VPLSLKRADGWCEPAGCGAESAPEPLLEAEGWSSV